VRGTDVQHSPTGETVMGMQLSLVMIVVAFALLAVLFVVIR
jgi:hypothetical protein